MQIQRKTLADRFEGNKVQNIAKIAVNSRKKTDIPTHLITLELLQNGIPLESIASTRGLSVGTIVSHIEKSKGLKLIDQNHLEPLKDQLPKEDFDIILSELEKSEDGKLKPIYDKYEGKYSYASIQIVRLFAG